MLLDVTEPVGGAVVVLIIISDENLCILRLKKHSTALGGAMMHALKLPAQGLSCGQSCSHGVSCVRYGTCGESALPSALHPRWFCRICASGVMGCDGQRLPERFDTAYRFALELRLHRRQVRGAGIEFCRENGIWQPSSALAKPLHKRAMEATMVVSRHNTPGVPERTLGAQYFPDSHGPK